MTNKFMYAIILISCALYACVKPPVYPDIPEISVTSVDQFRVSIGPFFVDSLSIKIEFTDGNGDIGFDEGYIESNLFIQDSLDNFNIIGQVGKGIVLDSTAKVDTTAFNVLLTDNRTGFTYGYVIPFIEKKGNAAFITGEIKIGRKAFCRPFFPKVDTDTLRYKIQILDRADNLSNVVYTPLITLTCQ